MGAMRALLIAGLVAMLFGSAAAESATQHFTCVFDRYVSPDTNGVSRTAFLYDIIVDDRGHAVAVGQNVNPVYRFAGIDGVTFVEPLATGAVQSTTIHTNGEAVHSRHTIIFGEFVPSQYYGTCQYEGE